MNMYYIFPEQFTVKAHPALFEGEEGEPKNEALLFQSTIDIHALFQSAHKTPKNCEDSHSVHLYFKWIVQTITFSLWNKSQYLNAMVC